MKNKIALSDLKHRRVYQIYSRNLIVGVWNEPVQGFIGIREKFGSFYLFTEYEYETNGNLGTAFAIKDLNIDVPADIELVERLGTISESTRRPVYFRRHIPPDPRGYWIYRDDETICHEIPISVHNDALFDFLKVYDDSYEENDED